MEVAGGGQRVAAAAGKPADEISKNKPTEQIWGSLKANKLLKCWREAEDEVEKTDFKRLSIQLFRRSRAEKQPVSTTVTQPWDWCALNTVRLLQQRGLPDSRLQIYHVDFNTRAAD